jgi:hypothetical protein
VRIICGTEGTPATRTADDGNMREQGVRNLIACAPDRDQHRAAARTLEA